MNTANVNECTRCGKPNLDPDFPHWCTPRALVLADELLDGMSDEHWSQLRADAAAELRRLYSVNERLLRERHFLVESSQKDAATITEKEALLRQALDVLVIVCGGHTEGKGIDTIAALRERLNHTEGS